MTAPADPRLNAAILAGRARLMAGRPTVDADSLRREAAARVNAEASVREAAPVTLAAASPAAAKIARGDVSSGRVLNPKIWDDDRRACYKGRKVVAGLWLGAVRKFAKARSPGDVLEPYTYGVAQRLAHHSEVGKGCAQVTYDALAFEVGCSRETIRKVLRSLENAGLLVTKNVMARVKGNFLWRVANSYFVRLPDEPWPTLGGEDPELSDAPAAELSMVRRAAKFAGYAIQFFTGLVARPTGLNTTGLRLGRPEPA